MRDVILALAAIMVPLALAWIYGSSRFELIGLDDPLSNYDLRTRRRRSLNCESIWNQIIHSEVLVPSASAPPGSVARLTGLMVASDQVRTDHVYVVPFVALAEGFTAVHTALTDLT